MRDHRDSCILHPDLYDGDETAKQVASTIKHFTIVINAVIPNKLERFTLSPPYTQV